MPRPYSPSCDENKDVIFSVIKPYLVTVKTLLEIGSGTGQHAVDFAAKLPHVNWQTSDLSENLDGIKQWLDIAQLNNLKPPLELDVSGDWPVQCYDAIFSANALHILGKEDVENCFSGITKVMNECAVCLIYGPFNYQGQYTSESNARFDQWLKNNNPKSGIKDFEWIYELATHSGMSLIQDHDMPANNRLLAFKK